VLGVFFKVAVVNETDNVMIKPSPIHGLGGFAKRDLAPGTRVIEYVGERITPTESIERCRHGEEYIFRLSGEVHLDGNVAWNPARYLNHSCTPNCEAEFINGKIWIVAKRAIKAGEELTFDYGHDLENFRDHPCHCGSLACCGYILAQEFRDSLPQSA
jgi:uncharacterized protein